MGAKRNVSMTTSTDTVKRVDPQAADAEAAQPTTAAETKKKKAVTTKKPRRSKKYVSARSFVDKTKQYELGEAVALVKKTSYSKFAGTVTADMVVKEVGEQVALTFPHSTGKTARVAIADDALIEQIANGVIDFDVLLATPAFVPKLAKHAKVLGPKGLMPNPKNGTITQQPEARKKELEGGKITIKSERKAPLVHVAVGKTDMADEQLVANVQALITAMDFRLKKLTLSATMGPSVKVKLG